MKMNNIKPATKSFKTGKLNVFSGNSNNSKAYSARH